MEKKNEPKSAMGFRLDYFFWSFLIYRKMKKKINRTKIHHVNFAQILTPVPKKIAQSDNFTFGPVGGQGPWYRVRFMNLKNRILNFFLFKIIYKFFKIRKIKNIIFVHPLLAKEFNASNVLPAIKVKKMGREKILYSNKKKQVIHVARRVYFKLPELHEKIFSKLAYLNPDFDFLIIGSGWKKESNLKNFKFSDHIERSQVNKLFRESQFHINLSLELAGFVNLEAALNKCITVGAIHSGSEFLLKLKGKYLIDIYDKNQNVDQLVSHLSEIIQDYDIHEAESQFFSAKKYEY